MPGTSDTEPRGKAGESSLMSRRGLVSTGSMSLAASAGNLTARTHTLEETARTLREDFEDQRQAMQQLHSFTQRAVAEIKALQAQKQDQDRAQQKRLEEEERAIQRWLRKVLDMPREPWTGVAAADFLTSPVRSRAPTPLDIQEEWLGQPPSTASWNPVGRTHIKEPLSPITSPLAVEKRASALFSQPRGVRRPGAPGSPTWAAAKQGLVAAGGCHVGQLTGELFEIKPRTPTVFPDTPITDPEAKSRRLEMLLNGPLASGGSPNASWMGVSSGSPTASVHGKRPAPLAI